jgi:hypothetical protein
MQQCVVWTEYTNTFTANSASTVITIDNLTGGYNGSIILDNLDIEPLNASATPLPATLPLFAGGLGFVGYLAKRRKKNATLALAAA